MTPTLLCLNLLFVVCCWCFFQQKGTKNFALVMGDSCETIWEMRGELELISEAQKKTKIDSLVNLECLLFQNTTVGLVWLLDVMSAVVLFVTFCDLFQNLLWVSVYCFWLVCSTAVNSEGQHHEWTSYLSRDVLTHFYWVHFVAVARGTTGKTGELCFNCNVFAVLLYKNKLSRNTNIIFPMLMFSYASV